MSYAQLESHQARLAHLRHACAILNWDEAVVMAEPAGPARAGALATLRGLIHERATHPGVGEWIATARASEGALEPWQAANLAEIERDWLRATCVPTALVEAATRAETRCEQAWRKLRPANDWATFRPLLEEVVALQRERAAALGEARGLADYDALLDGYEPGVTSAEIDRLFAELRAFLPDFTEAVLERQHHETCVLPRGPFDPERQRALGSQLMEAVGFDRARGRLDSSHHPFCGGVPQDVRITTRYDDSDFSKALMGVLHETGHALYEQGLPEAWIEQPVGRARSMSFHESQSLLREMQVSRSREFLGVAAPFIHEAFPERVAAQPDAFASDNLYRCYTRVRRDFIRVDADEVTYPSHILVRYDIERRLIAGELAVRDIPEQWDAAMQELLGLSTADDYDRGCMQDVHWAAGAFGYFPTYTLGAMIAAQLFAAIVRDVPDVRDQIGRGEFDALNTWLGERIWSRASSRSAGELLIEATGSELSPNFYREHLTQRYLDDG